MHWRMHQQAYLETQAITPRCNPRGAIFGLQRGTGTTHRNLMTKIRSNRLPHPLDCPRARATKTCDCRGCKWSFTIALAVKVCIGLRWRRAARRFLTRSGTHTQCPTRQGRPKGAACHTRHNTTERTPVQQTRLGPPSEFTRRFMPSWRGGMPSGMRRSDAQRQLSMASIHGCGAGAHQQTNDKPAQPYPARHIVAQSTVGNMARTTSCTMQRYVR